MALRDVSRRGSKFFVVSLSFVLLFVSACSNSARCPAIGDSTSRLSELALSDWAGDDAYGKKRDARSAWKMYAGAAGLGAGLALSGVGVAGAVMSYKRADQAFLEDSSRERDVLITQSEHYDYMSAWTLGTGVPLLVVGIILMAIDGAEAATYKKATADEKEKGKSRSTSFLPAVGADGSVGMVFSTSF